MRVSDDRYNRDRLRFDLAVRMIRHEARTCTIRAWTGLSDDRIRKLYRAYLLHQPAPLRRHRGKSPRQIDYFLRNPELHFEGTTLASLFCMLGLFPGTPAARLESHVSMERAELFCQAYETYLSLHDGPLVSFEHAWFLLVALIRREEVALAACAMCGRLFLRHAIRSHVTACSHCSAESPGMPRRRKRGAPGSSLVEHREWSTEVESESPD